ncbi:DNA repair endonuclease [Schizosaccharomyces cryophilus OY26]|uniref:DNA repair endonuclease n=1 Tax=Schizosaccharomyces cryophilus (strain OY26 / ATCC MYA-4695 / CBS 11777 / NBRC 106824 / NRRL Y48691) TaxID=653667 RepID=S9VZE6_SCHCR|nr:DNA repair endonuclease [Schizosaccharomyces cryophilus OY26]EPY51559.1 DNA repair endonuclease [Schizosaccharomyces cryophilus OY26]
MNSHLEEKINNWRSNQLLLKERIVFTSKFKDVDSIRYIAGLDISFDKTSPKAVSAIVIYDLQNAQVIYKDYLVIDNLREDYVPGFLSFREIEYYLPLLKRIPPSYCFDLIMVDGNGILHPIQFGLACHLGVLTNSPTMGVAKNYFHCFGLNESLDDHRQHLSNYISTNTSKPPLFLYSIGEPSIVLGAAVWTRKESKRPIYVSIGNQISLDIAIQLVFRTSGVVSKIPEPIRQADIFAKFVIHEQACSKKE